MGMKPITILTNLLRSAEATPAEVRDCALEADTLEALSALFGRTVEETRKAIEEVADEELVDKLAATIRIRRERAKDQKATRVAEDAQAAADVLAVEAVRGEYAIELDPRRLFALADQADARTAISFRPDDSVAFAVNVRRLRALGENLRRRDVTVRARLVFDDVRVHSEARQAPDKWVGRRRTQGGWLPPVDVSRKAAGWCLIVEWQAPKGARGYMRFQRADKTFTKTVKGRSEETYGPIPVETHVVIPAAQAVAS